MVKYYLLYDGDCGICSKSAELVHKNDKLKVFEIMPYQFFDFAQYPRLNEDIAQTTVILIKKDLSKHLAESAAVFEILYNLKGIYKILGLILNNPIFIFISNPIYRIIAKNRAKISTMLGLNACKVRYWNKIQSAHG